jgi:hypothetical protein
VKLKKKNINLVTQTKNKKEWGSKLT